MRSVLCFILILSISLSGAYAIISALFPSASLKSKRAIRLFGKTGSKYKNRSMLFEVPTAFLSKKIAPHIRLRNLRYVQLKNSLKSSGYADTPEQFTAIAVSEFIILLLFCLPLFFFSRVLSSAVFVFAVYYIIFRFRNLGKSSEEKARGIERELPRFVSYIKQGLSTNRNALLLIERYRSANPIFAEELSRTVADIKTSNFETALLRLGSRYNSEHLSMLIRGLIGIYNGDDVRYYFEMLDRDFTELETDRLRLEVRKIPNKMRKSMIVIYAAIVFMFFTPVVILISESLQKFFS